MQNRSDKAGGPLVNQREL